MKAFMVLLILCFGCSVIPRYSEVGHYEVVYGVCPEDPTTSHNRMMGKHFDPEKCNFTY